jgi:hypothetical protein
MTGKDEILLKSSTGCRIKCLRHADQMHIKKIGMQPYFIFISAISFVNMTAGRPVFIRYLSIDEVLFTLM